MRKKHISFYNKEIRTKKEEQKKHPVPKILYSTSENFFRKISERQKEIIEKQSPKFIVQDLVAVVNKFTNEIDFDNEDSVDDKFDVDKKFELNKDEDKEQNIIDKRAEEFFLTNKNNLKKKDFSRTQIEKEINNDLEHVKAESETITALPKINEINNEKKLFKNNLLFENYGKYKFTRTGLTYPKKLDKYELPMYSGINKDDKNYFNYRKKVRNPNLVYNKLSNFSETFNKDLGMISANYGKTFSRTRFTENPLLKKYMEMIPIYDIYKDLKQIENRYIGSKYKFKLLPLYNKRITNLDKLADKFYKVQAAEKGLGSLLNIQNVKS